MSVVSEALKTGFYFIFLEKRTVIPFIHQIIAVQVTSVSMLH